MTLVILLGLSAIGLTCVLIGLGSLIGRFLHRVAIRGLERIDEREEFSRTFYDEEVSAERAAFLAQLRAELQAELEEAGRDVVARHTGRWSNSDAAAFQAYCAERHIWRT